MYENDAGLGSLPEIVPAGFAAFCHEIDPIRNPHAIASGGEREMQEKIR